MVIRIDIKGVDRLTKYFIDLPKKLDKELSKSNIDFTKKIRKSAKLRAPRDTNELAESIEIMPIKVKGRTKQYGVQATAPHAGPQETGFKPHWAFIRNSSKLVPGLYFVKKFTPFLAPAVEANIVKFGQDLDRGITRAIQ